MEMNRGVCFVAWGQQHLTEAINASAYATKQGLPTCLLTDEAPEAYLPHFTIVKKVDFTRFNNINQMFRKWICLTETPFQNTCYLDTDCTVQGDLSLGFLKAEQHGICLTIAPGMTFLYEKEYIHYNGALMFFTSYRPDLQRQLIFHAQRNQSINGDEPVVSLVLDAMNINPVVLPSTFCLVRSGQIHTRPIRVFHSMGWPATHLASDQYGNDFPRISP